MPPVFPHQPELNHSVESDAWLFVLLLLLGFLQGKTLCTEVGVGRALSDTPRHLHNNLLAHELDLRISNIPCQ